MDVRTNQQTNNEIKRTSESGHRFWIVSYIILAIVCVAIYFLLQFQVFGLLGIYRSLIQRLALAGLVIAFVFIATKTIETIVTNRSQTKKVSYNIIRLIRFLSVMIAAF